MKDQTQNRVSKIVSLFFHGSYPEQFTKEVQKWLVADIHKKEKDMALWEIWDEMVQPDDDPTKESYRDTCRSYNKIAARLGIPGAGKKPITALSRVAVRIAAVLIPAVLVVGGAFLLWNPLRQATHADITAETVVEQRRIVLPDNSEVWLNAGSCISYSSEFAEERMVLLTGEARFSVRKAEGTPFTVKTGKLAVTVLGTEFNVKGYGDGTTSEVSVLSGRVEVVHKRRKAVLEPAQKLTLVHATSEFAITGYSEESLGWKPARLHFDDTPLEEAFRTIGIYYDMPVEFRGEIPGNRVTVKFLDNEMIDNVLYILENTTQAFDHVVEDGKIIIKAR